MLFFLTDKFPLFQSSDDVEALMEIAAIIGRRRMEKVATLHSAFFARFGRTSALNTVVRSHVHHECAECDAGRDDVARIHRVAESQLVGTESG
jgi:hypothetical protein